MLSFLIRYKIGKINPYESDKLNIKDVVRNNLPHFFSLDSVHVFLSKIASDYMIYIVMLVIGAIWLLAHKKYLRVLALCTISICYWILIMICFPTDTRFYTENMLLPLGFIAAIPMVVDIIPILKWRLAPAFFLFIILMRLTAIYEAHKDYTAHYAIYDPYFKYLSDTKLKGIFVDEQQVDSKKAIMTWASGYESLLLTSLASPDSARIVQIDNNISKYQWAVNADSSLVTIYWTWQRDQLPRRYFRLRGGGYEILNKKL